MADQKLTELTALTSPTADDLLYIVDAPGGSPVSKKVTVENLLFGEWSVGTTTAGCDANGTSGSSFSSGIIQIIPYRFLKVTQVLWDVQNTGTYSLYLHAGPYKDTVIKTLVNSQSVISAPSEVTFDLSSTPLYLYPCTYYLGIYKMDGAATMRYYNVGTITNALFYGADSYYDDTASNYTQPVKLVAYTSTFL